jgi:ribonuclease HII
MSSGDLSTRVKVKGNDELTDLASTFNRMATNLELAEDRKKAMTADVAHELRTPIAVQKAQLEGMLDGVIPATSENLGIALQQTDFLSRLVDDLRLLAMADAVARLSPVPDFLLIDGITPLPGAIPQRTIKKGDSLSLSVAAASIVAKVTRDRLMSDYDHCYPGYGFAAHKGYGSAEHMAAIARLGPSPIHRRTFRGVREYLQGSHDQ